LYTVAGERRTVAALDPATGETLWTFREPATKRWEMSMRKNYGKGVAYHEVNGRGRIYMLSPAFLLHALDAETGRPVEGFGNNGVVDPLADFGYPYHPTDGLPTEVGYITSSSRPDRRATSSSSATRTSRATTRRAWRTSRATSWPTTPPTESSSGSST
jgi:glucose dehydrogenase